MLRKIVLIIAILISGALPAFADFYFQQDIHALEKDTNPTHRTDTDFVRKVYILEGIFSVQIFEKSTLKKEYGFDFKKNLYYEADPDTHYYKWFDLVLLNTAFEKMDQSVVRSFHGTTRQSVVRNLAKNMEEGRLNYPVRVHQTLWLGKNIDGHKTTVYKLREGPGGTFLNPFGWYHTEKIVATKDVPGFVEYSRIQAQLAEKGRFYKIKHNRISDFIVSISSLNSFPLGIETFTYGRFGRPEARETQREITSFISTEKIRPEQLLYFKEKTHFSWNVRFSEGTDFGPEVAMPPRPDLRRSLSGFLIPAFFLFFAYLWFIGGYEAKSILSLERFVVLRVFMFFSLLLVLEIVHYFTEMPFLKSPFFEFSFLLVLSVIWIFAEAMLHRKHLAAQMREQHLLSCPHCGAPIEELYLVCPKCNFSLREK